MLNGPPGMAGGGWQIAQPKDGAGKAQPPRPPTFAERGSAVLFGAAIRQVAGSQPRAKDAAVTAAKAHDLAVAQAKAAATAQGHVQAGHGRGPRDRPRAAEGAEDGD